MKSGKVVDNFGARAEFYKTIGANQDVLEVLVSLFQCLCLPSSPTPESWTTTRVQSIPEKIVIRDVAEIRLVALSPILEKTKWRTTLFNKIRVVEREGKNSLHTMLGACRFGRQFVEIR